MGTHLTGVFAAMGLVSGLCCATIPGVATETPAQIPPPDGCLTAVNAIGARMGEAVAQHGNGGMAYRFVVRTNGLDYDVVCDPATGLVSDVAPRGTAGSDSN